MKNVILTTLLVLAGMAARGQKVTPLSATSPIAGGATYFLPQVGLVVNVPITTTTYTLGPDFSKKCRLESFHFKTDVRKALDAYIEPYLKKDSVNHMDIEPYKTYELGAVMMSPKSIRDPNKGFRMHVERRGKKASFQYDENDFLVSGSVENNNDVLPLILKAVDAGISSLKPWGLFPFAFMKSDESLKPNSEKPPCQTIQTINKLGEVKNTLLLKGDVAGSGLTQQLEAIDRQIQFYTDRIMKVTEKTETISFYVLPEKPWLDCKCDRDLFSYDSATNVLTVNTDLAPRILTEKYSDERVRIGVVSDGFKLAIKTLPEESITDKFSGQMHLGYKGLAYNIPEKCKVSVRNGLSLFASQRVDFPQFGKVGFMSHRLKRLDYTLDPLTGALRSMTGEAKAGITADNIDQTTGILEKLKKRSAPTEKENLTEEVATLELQVKKKKAKEELEKGN